MIEPWFNFSWWNWNYRSAIAQSINFFMFGTLVVKSVGWTCFWSGGILYWSERLVSPFCLTESYVDILQWFRREPIFNPDPRYLSINASPSSLFFFPSKLPSRNTTNTIKTEASSPRRHSMQQTGASYLNTLTHQLS